MSSTFDASRVFEAGPGITVTSAAPAAVPSLRQSWLPTFTSSPEAKKRVLPMGVNAVGNERPEKFSVFTGAVPPDVPSVRQSWWPSVGSKVVKKIAPWKRVKLYG